MVRHGTLLDILLRHAPESRSFNTAIHGFRIARRDIPHIIERCVINPTLFVTVQGRKRTIIGNIPYEYGAGQTVINGMDLPGDSIVLDASPEKPYLSMIIELDAALITEISAELPVNQNSNDTDKQNVIATACTETDPSILDAFTR